MTLEKFPFDIHEKPAYNIVAAKQDCGDCLSVSANAVYWLGWAETVRLFRS